MAQTQPQPKPEPPAQPQYDTMPIYQQFLEAERSFTKEMSKEEKAAVQQAKMWKQTLMLDVGRILRGSADLSLEDEMTRRRIDGWFTFYYFARLTHPENLSEWTEIRQKFLKSLTPTSVPPEVHDHLVDLTMRLMATIAKGNFHPAARCNAMLLIGELNKSEAVLIGDAKRLPIPSIQGLAIMLNELEDPKQIDAVRVAALAGIYRHVKIDRELPKPNRRLLGGPGERRIVDLMLGLVNAQQPPEGRSLEGHNWMRRRAVEILGQLGSAGQNGKVVSALDALVADETAPVSLRCTAAESLGWLEYPPNTQLDVTETAKKLAGLGAFACLKEVRHREDEQQREQADTEDPDARDAGYPAPGYPSPTSALPGMFGPPTLPGADFDPRGYRVALTRRRVKYYERMVRRGLLGRDADAEEKPKRPSFGAAKPDEEAKPKPGGLSALAKSDADKEAVDKAASSITGIIEVTHDPNKDLTSLLTDLRTKVTELETNCGIVADLGEAEEEAAGPGQLLENPLEALGTGLGAGLPAGPPTGPPTGPPAGPPAKTPSTPTPRAPGKTAPPPAKTPEPGAATPAPPPAKPLGGAPAAPPAGAPGKPPATVPPGKTTP